MFFLNALGIPYPDIDVDQVREMGQSINEFAVDVRRTFDEGTGTIGEVESAMSGDSYQAILVQWSYILGKMEELDTAFDIAAAALDIAADVIEAVQIAVLIELAALAASFIASMFTPAAPATGPLLAAAARQIAKEMAEFVMWYIAAELLAKALDPMLDRFDQFIRDALRPPDVAPPAPGSAPVTHMDPDAVSRYITILENQARDMEEHGQKLNDRLDNLDFTTPGLDVPPGEWPSPTSVVPPAGSTQPVPLPSIPPNMLPDEQQPIAETPSRNPSAPEAGSSAPGDQPAKVGTAPPAGVSSGTETSQPTTVTPETVSPAASAAGAAPGDSLSPMSVSPGGIDSSGQGGNSADSGSITPDSVGSSSDPAGSAFAHYGPGVTAAMGPQSAMQTSPSASASAPGQSQAGSAASNGQRPTDAAGKAQGSAGRASGGPGGSDAGQPSGRKSSKTPWSRAGGKAARVAPETEPSGRKVPAVSAGESGTSGEEARTTSATSPGHEGPQVFAPSVAAPPPESSNDKSTGEDRDRDVPVEAPVKDSDTSGVGGRS